MARLGRGLVKGMPKLLTALTVIGTAAMLWVGGHILLVGTDDLGLHVLYGAVHHLEEIAHEAAGALGGLVAGSSTRWPARSSGSSSARSSWSSRPHGPPAQGWPAAEAEKHERRTGTRRPARDPFLRGRRSARGK